MTHFERLRPHFEGVDWVFHLAGLADIVPSIQHPLAYLATNVDGCAAVAEAARLAGAGGVVYAASSTCYGLPDTVPTPETAPIRPMYPYALSKYLGEEIMLSWHKIYRLPVVSLRLFNVYGPRSRTTGTYGAVFGVFLAQKLAGKPFTVVGDGRQTRDFTYVTDVADAMVRTAESDAARAKSSTWAPAAPTASTGWWSCWAAGRCMCPSARESPTAPSPIPGRSRPRWAGAPRWPSPTGSRGCSSTSTSGATPRCGTSPRWPRPPATGSSHLGK